MFLLIKRVLLYILKLYRGTLSEGEHQLKEYLLRTTLIRDHLKNRFGDLLHFQRSSNCEVSKPNTTQPYILNSMIDDSQKKRFQNISDCALMSDPHMLAWDYLSQMFGNNKSSLKKKIEKKTVNYLLTLLNSFVLE